MIRPSDSPIVLVTARMIAPLIQLMGLYVIFHGHYSPGGGFQGGVLLAASFVLLRLSFGSSLGRRQLPPDRATLLSSAGVLVYLGVGLIALAAGGAYLDYGALPLGDFAAAKLRHYGILIIELGVGLVVATALVSIYDDLLASSERA